MKRRVVIFTTGEKISGFFGEEEDGRTVSSFFGEEAVVLIALGEADRLVEIVELLVPLSGCLFQDVKTLPESVD